MNRMFESCLKPDIDAKATGLYINADTTEKSSLEMRAKSRADEVCLQVW